MRCLSSFPFRDEQTEPISATTAEPLARGDSGGEVSARSLSDSPPAMRPREFDEEPPPYATPISR
jgi:hypothetical protein